MILGALFVMIETGFELFIPIMISNLIDIGVANHDVNYIYVKGVQMALLALGALAVWLTVWCFGWFVPWAVKVIVKLCKKPFEKKKEREA